MILCCKVCDLWNSGFPSWLQPQPCPLPLASHTIFCKTRKIDLWSLIWHLKTQGQGTIEPHLSWWHRMLDPHKTLQSSKNLHLTSYIFHYLIALRCFGPPVWCFVFFFIKIILSDTHLQNRFLMLLHLTPGKSNAVRAPWNFIYFLFCNLLYRKTQICWNHWGGYPGPDFYCSDWGCHESPVECLLRIEMYLKILLFTSVRTPPSLWWRVSWQYTPVHY